MSKKIIASLIETNEDTGVILRWGKLVTRITAIGATVTGAFAAIFSSSSVASGVALTAAGASTLAAAEKLPNQGYVKTKHVSPLGSATTKRELGTDTLKPEIPRMAKAGVPRLQPRFPQLPPSTIGRRNSSSEN